MIVPARRHVPVGIDFDRAVHGNTTIISKSAIYDRYNTFPGLLALVSGGKIITDGPESLVDFLLSFFNWAERIPISGGLQSPIQP